MWQVEFKCPGGGTVTMTSVPGADGHAARRAAIVCAIARGYSRQVGQWASSVRRA